MTAQNLSCQMYAIDQKRVEPLKTLPSWNRFLMSFKNLSLNFIKPLGLIETHIHLCLMAPSCKIFINIAQESLE